MAIAVDDHRGPGYEHHHDDPEGEKTPHERQAEQAHDQGSDRAI
jgi:hypothetical protein